MDTTGLGIVMSLLILEGFLVAGSVRVLAIGKPPRLTLLGQPLWN